MNAPEPLHRRSVTLAQSIAVVAFTAAIAWSATRLVDSYRDSGVTDLRDRDQDALRAQLTACRDRELDDVKARLRIMESRGHE